MHSLLDSSIAKDLYNPFQDGVTQGALATWHACPERARLKLFERLGTNYFKTAAEFGNIVHENLEKVYEWYSAVLNGSGADSIDLQAVVDASSLFLQDQENEHHKKIMSEMGSADTAAQVDFLYAQASVMLFHYFRQWPQDFSDVDWVGLEIEFNEKYGTGWPIFNHAEKKCEPIPLRGKIDGVFRSKKGSKGLWLFETKTKRVIDDPSIISRLSLDLQTGMYMLVAERIYGEPLEGVIYNLIRSPQLRQGAKESKNDFLERLNLDVNQRIDTYYKRVEYTVSQEDRARFREEFDVRLREFVKWATNQGPHFRNDGACDNGFWKCEFLNGCGNGNWDGYVVRDSVYPELPGLKLTEA